ncbi:YveK family protein [Peribacillus frigoritolerans]|uniref:YveK family protein n=1 Tax=Peribacillus frigoritolerans TaxID=450367 RepID=UPI000FD835C7|nr:Wzz/FepE/Etk N-terminal domain-containing protein [Peribacillus frigoritolerans]AZV63417.1 capsular biosynthesis protein [Peribacillus frigoritolerans]
MEETVSFKEIIQTIKKWRKLIVLLTLIAALISGTISYFLLTPVYEASTQLLVNQKREGSPLDPNQIQSNIDMINTYSVIIKSPAILGKVIDDLGLTQSVEQLNEKITINIQGESQVFSLTIEDSDPAKAVEIANKVSNTFQKEISNIMNVDNVSILAKAEMKENPAPIKPNSLLNIAIALIVGLVAGVGLAFLLEYMDNTIKDDKDIETLLDLPVLGSIQKMPQVQDKE